VGYELVSLFCKLQVFQYFLHLVVEEYSKQVSERDFVHMGTSASFTFGFLKILKSHIFMYFKITILNM
jgi:hypothetical protein